MIIRIFVFCAGLLALSGCVSFPDAPPPIMKASIADDAVISVDDARLGLTKWEAEKPKAALVAVHGMNDYAAAFALAGPYWAERGISVYAYDQRGFGRSPQFGQWAGGDVMKQDLRAAIDAVRSAHPDLPVYVVGHSMGAGVILAAMKDGPLDVDGVILAAPGIWGGASMSIFYRTTLSLAATFAPGKTLTGERAGKQASDNIEFLRAMYADPLIIKETRIDSILGAERIMGDGFDASNEVGGDILFIFGERDEIIPIKAMRKTARRLCGDVVTIAYPESWHLIFADLAREAPLDDVADWINADILGETNWRPQNKKGILEHAVSGCEGSRD